jgi:hypothetical protein
LLFAVNETRRSNASLAKAGNGFTVSRNPGELTNRDSARTRYEPSGTSINGRTRIRTGEVASDPHRRKDID